IPGFLRRPEVEAYLQSRRLVTWSADIVADDWRHISASEVVRRAITRLDEKGKGIILLHDIQPATALALPELLRELKAKGYRVVRGGRPPPGGPRRAVAAKAAPPTREAGPPPTATPAAGVAQAAPPAPTPPPAVIAAEPPAPKPVLPPSAADSLARAVDVPQD